MQKILMPSYIVIIQPEAEQDLDEAYLYLEQQRTGLGFQLLEDNPLLFQKVYGEKSRLVVFVYFCFRLAHFTSLSLPKNLNTM